MTVKWDRNVNEIFREYEAKAEISWDSVAEAELLTQVVAQFVTQEQFELVVANAAIADLMESVRNGDR